MSETNQLCRKLGAEYAAREESKAQQSQDFGAYFEAANVARAKSEGSSTSFVDGCVFGAVLATAFFGAVLLASDAMARAAHDIAMVWG